MNNAPCKKGGVDCPKRFLGCHDSCKDYQDFAAERERFRAERNKENRELDYVKAFLKKRKYKRYRRF